MCHCSEKTTKLNFWLSSAGAVGAFIPDLNYEEESSIKVLLVKFYKCLIYLRHNTSGKNVNTMRAPNVRFWSALIFLNKVGTKLLKFDPSDIAKTEWKMASKTKVSNHEGLSNYCMSLPKKDQAHYLKKIALKMVIGFLARTCWPCVGILTVAFCQSPNWNRLRKQGSNVYKNTNSSSYLQCLCSFEDLFRF